MWRKIVLALAGLAAAAVVAGLVVIGPRNAVGMLRYDTRAEGAYKVGDRAPDVELRTLDGATLHLAERFGERPTVLIFGSFT
jgi:cytochrome oxidase Cu insertion factor (SCO1/SenC/PrrC family)